MKIVLIGDSTVTASKGWGKAFEERLSDKVRVFNFSVGGRSSKSWYDENRLPAALSVKPDYVLIQFGHNDQPGKGMEIETDPDTTYRDYLKIYVEECLRVGAKPILVSPVTRRTFEENGKIKSTLTPWADAVKTVAEQMGVPFVDLHSASIKYHNMIGPQASMELNYIDEDTTHFNHKGARVMADLIIQEVIKIDKDLAK